MNPVSFPPRSLIYQLVQKLLEPAPTAADVPRPFWVRPGPRQVRRLKAPRTSESALHLAGTPEAFEPLIQRAADRYGVDARLVRAMIRAESGFNPDAVSPAGARGLMQLMPATAASLGVSDAFDPRQNIDGGVRLLRQLLDRYHGNVVYALAAYNAGPGAVDKYGGIPPYRETRTYVPRVLGFAGGYSGYSMESEHEWRV